MANDIYKQLEKIAEKEYSKQLNIILNQSLKLFKKAVQYMVYDYYKPTWWNRRKDFLNSVTGRIGDDGKSVLIYIDTSKLLYTSIVDYYDTGRDVTEYVPKWINDGHDHKTIKTQNQYFHYEGRGYLELAKELIETQYGVFVTIINT